MNATIVVCGKCGKTEKYNKAVANGWLIEQRIDKPAGHLIVRCDEHVTDYARRQAGLKQQYYHEHKA